MSNNNYLFENPESSRDCAYNELVLMGEDPMDAWAAIEMMNFADDYEDDDDEEADMEAIDALIDSWDLPGRREIE